MIRTVEVQMVDRRICAERVEPKPQPRRRRVLQEPHSDLRVTSVAPAVHYVAYQLCTMLHIVRRWRAAIPTAADMPMQDGTKCGNTAASCNTVSTALEQPPQSERWPAAPMQHATRQRGTQLVGY